MMTAQMSQETICLSTTLCLEEESEGQTAYGYQGTMFREAFSAFDEAFKNSQQPLVTWHYYSKWLILPSLVGICRAQCQCVQAWAVSALKYSKFFLCDLGQITYSSVLWDPDRIFIKKK